MSANRKLRFQRLPGGDGLTALSSLSKCRDSTFTYQDQSELWPQLRNAFIQVARSDYKLALVLSSDQKEKIKHLLQSSGWDLMVLSFDQVDSLPQLDRKLKAFQSQSFPDASGSWHRLYNAWDLLEYHETSLKSKALGENDLEHLLAQFVTSVAQEESDLIDLLANPGDFEFNTQEYWSIRGRVHQTALLYRASFDDLKGLPLLHPIFAEMYTSEEARVAIIETTTRFLSMARGVFSDLSQWTHRVYRSMFSNEQVGCNTIRQGLLDLRQKIAEIEITSDHNEGGWLSTFSPANKQSEQEDLIAAYNVIRQQARELGLSTKDFFGEANNITEVAAEVTRALNNMNAIKRLIKVHGDGMRLRLNRHTLKDQVLLQEYDEINKDWAKLLEEMNGFQLLKEDRVDVSLDIPAQIKLVESLILDLDQIINESQHLEKYIDWLHFSQSLDQKSRKLISILHGHRQQKWLSIFDTWYAHQYILSQDLPTIDTKWLQTNWAALVHHLSSREEDVAMEKMVQRLNSKWKAFNKTHKSFNKWLTSGTVYPELEEEKSLSARAFQIVLFAKEDIDEVERWDPDVILEIDGASLSRKVGPTVRWLQGKEAVQNKFNFFPDLHPNLIHSDHSQRIDEIKTLGEHLIKHYAPFEVWQNNHEVYLIFGSKEVKRVLWSQLGGDFQKKHITASDRSNVVVETLLNNRQRSFFGVFTANVQPKLKINDLTVLWEGLNKVGVENHYLCWKDLLQNSLILQMGIKQHHGKNQPPYRTHPVAKRH